MKMTSEQEAQLARRLASLSRWAAVMNYLLMYPDARKGYAHEGLGTMNDHAAFQFVAERICMHSHAIKDLIK